LATRKIEACLWKRAEIFEKLQRALPADELAQHCLLVVQQHGDGRFGLEHGEHTFVQRHFRVDDAPTMKITSGGRDYWIIRFRG